MAFVASPAGCDAMTEALGVDRAVPGRGLRDSRRRPADRRGHAAVLRVGQHGARPGVPVAGEGPEPRERSLVEVGSGIRSGEEGAAALYDEDAAKQAQQLGLPGW